MAGATPIQGPDGSFTLVPDEWLQPSPLAQGAPPDPDPLMGWEPPLPQAPQDATTSQPSGPLAFPTAPRGPGQSGSYGREGPTYTPQQAQGFTGSTRQNLAQLDRQREARIAAGRAEIDKMTANEVQDAKDRAEVEAKIAKAQAPVQQAVADYTRDFNKYEQETLASTQQEATAKRLDYEKRLATLGQMGVDPARLYRDGEGLAAGGIAAFLGGFLTAGGVKNDIVAQLNKTIDRDIDAQMANLQHQRQVTEGFANAYRMLVDENDSHAAARLKMRGLYLDQAQQDLAAAAAPYQSDLARIDAEDKINQLQKEAFKNKADYEKLVGDQISEDKRTAIDVGREALGYAGIRSAERMQKAELQAKKDAATAVVLPAAIRAGNGAITGKINPTFAGDKEVVREVQARALTQEQMGVKGLKILALMDKVGPQFKGAGGAAGKSAVAEWLASGDEDAEELRSSYTAYLNDKIYAATGKAVNESELNRQLTIYPLEGLLTGGNAANTFANRLADDNRTVQAAMNVYQVPLTPEELAMMQEGGQNYSPFADQGKVLDAQIRKIRHKRDEIDELGDAALAPGADILEGLPNWAETRGEGGTKRANEMAAQLGFDPRGPTPGSRAVDGLVNSFFWPGRTPQDRGRIIEKLQQFAGGGYEVPDSVERRASEVLEELYKVADTNPQLIPGLSRPKK